MRTGRAPYILAHEGEVTLFGTLEALARGIEAPDLEGARAFDSEGRVVLLSSPPVRRRFGFVNVPPVTAAMTESVQREDLRRALRDFVVDRRKLPEDALSEEPLAALLVSASSIARYVP